MTSAMINPDRLNQLPTITLEVGDHDSFDTGHCAMELAAWLADEPHTDHPQCVCPVIASFVRSWNDALPDDKRTALLRDLIPLTIGTRGSDDMQDRRALAAADWAVRVYTPRWLRLAGLSAEADVLAGLDPITSVEKAQATAGPIKQAREAADAAWAAAWAAAGAAARAAAWDAARAAAGAAAWAAAGDAAWAAAGAAARAAGGAAARAAAGAAARAAGGAAARAAGGAAARAAAWAAARAAGWDALAPTVDELQAEAVRFLTGLCNMTEGPDVADLGDADE